MKFDEIIKELNLKNALGEAAVERIVTLALLTHDLRGDRTTAQAVTPTAPTGAPLAEAAANKWVFPKLGDKVRLLKQEPYCAVPLTVGGVYEVAGFTSTCINSLISKSTDPYSNSKFALYIADHSAVRWIVGIDCLEPV